MIKQFIQDVEFGPVYAELALCSTSRMLLRVLNENKQLQSARYGLSLNREDSRLYLGRARYLAEQPVDEGYSNPQDLPLAAYISVLQSVQEDDSVWAFLKEVADGRYEGFTVATQLARHYSRIRPAVSVS
jgi:hypothetical protein